MQSDLAKVIQQFGKRKLDIGYNSNFNIIFIYNHFNRKLHFWKIHIDYHQELKSLASSPCFLNSGISIKNFDDIFSIFI